MAGTLDQMVETMLKTITDSITTRVTGASSGGGGGTSSVANVPPVQPVSAADAVAAGQAATTFARNASDTVVKLANLPDTSTAINYQLAAFQARGMGVSNNFENVEGQMRALANIGTITSPADVYTMTQQSGLAGMAGSNWLAYRNSAASISNIMPGLGVAASGQAYSSMQSGSNVNMLRALGINMRNPLTSNAQDINSVVNEIWQMLINLSGRTPTKEDINISLMPGNFLYRFITQYGGNDDMQQALIQALYAKAGGAKNLSKKEVRKAGMTSDVVNAMSDQTAAQLEGVQKSHGYLTSAAEHAADALEELSEGLHNIMPALAPQLWVKGASGRADGGPVNQSKAYVVGERGPEVFVPAESGVILPNEYMPDHMKKTGFSGGVETFKYAADGAEVKIKHGSHGDIKNWATEFLKQLGRSVGENLLTDRNMTFIGKWAQKEGGWKNNDAAYNPLNTTLRMDGSWSMNDLGNGMGVQGYLSLQDGIDATIKTLLGSKAKERGYSKIIKLLANPNASIDGLVKSVQRSSWGTKGDFSDFRVAWDPKATVSSGYITPGESSSSSSSGSNITGSSYSRTSTGTGIDVTKPAGEGNWLTSIFNNSRLSVSDYISSITAGNSVGRTVSNGAPVGRYRGGPADKGSQYLVGEMGPELFMPNDTKSVSAGANVTVQKIEIHVPSNFTEEKMVKELKRQMATGEIIRKARTR